jgi:hypothetical protein
MKTEKEIKQQYLEKIQKRTLPLFYGYPVFPKEDGDSLRVKYIAIEKYQTESLQAIDLKIIRPICKSFKL